MKKTIMVAIDGPSGAGKSTIARILARELQFVYVDTGALYRAVAFYMLQRGVSEFSEATVSPLLEDLHISLRYTEQGQRVFVGTTDVSDFIRTPEVSMAASKVSALPVVRAFLFQLQRQTAMEANVIMDGRDIGTVVLPEAGLKIFLTATPEERARRRHLELAEKGISTTFEEVLSDMVKRDHDDETRAAAPLKPAADAVLVDTSGYTLEESVELLKKMVKERFAL